MKIGLSSLQPLGRALMLPIAVLPVAGLLLRLGQPDLLDIAFVSAAGQAIFSNLGLLFAVGVAVGLARDNNGAAGLAGVVGYLITIEAAKVLMTAPPEVLAGLSGDAAEAAAKAFRDQALTRLGVPIGIISGLIAGDFYNRFSTLKLPEYLAFFGGRRFVPIAAGFAALAVAAIIGLSFSAIDHAIDVFSRTVVGSGEIGMFVYGLLNRLLIITGLHHILNNVAWFIVGDYHGATGDLNRFFAGDPTAGAFMSGFFPVMMFGLPAACLAMYHAARPERRKAVGGMLFSLALTAFLTGVTEPIEFTFMFLAPALYAIHAVLTGLAMVVMNLLDVHLGFTFSAGLFDYVLNFGKSTRPWMLLPVGLVYAGLYYSLFRVFIRVLNLKTPGREDDPVETVTHVTSGGRGEAFILALGGAANLVAVASCTTRLRLRIVSRDRVDEAALKRLGARGVIAPSPDSLQVVIGPTVEAVAQDIRDQWTAAPSAIAAAIAVESAPTVLSDTLKAALGGAANIRSSTTKAGRLCVVLADAAALNETALTAAAPKGFVRLGSDSVQVLV
ncbi:N-acetylglucosamine-specific PTS transporter subunit IIBC [Brevundimonas nasdae]|uniref:N-acetylglucosamine-specific PTS transporter subunit IIBC n=1 Tax=Brevundimonas nasdae TaxID=172043 RepID=A0ABX8TIM8_9CAUL|nr:N-acetylglucosamine-specific PTS transporter subunit IIBC [Brevundimonas nasdae]QYC10255.1 N-acetylglucosamine-specific PTS transporter subunit IIBC [Brevundimonas nasdae]QYC13043.1 N-acetylglucosamine-specific PTS transporter subunit IIBC [Brevundimonas nasdae]